ncbi:MAG: pilus assembly protein PilM, partial [Candidatus Omnitrophota bacterium]
FDFASTPLPVNIDDKELADKISTALKGLGYNNNPVIISLPRNQATCRYIKIPAKLPSEIEEIIPFQTSKYLPYPSSELVTSYQIVSTDKNGYSYINLNIVHKDIAGRYLTILKSLGIKRFFVLLSSYGLYNLYNDIQPKDNGITMVVDVDTIYAELIVISQKKLLFSRSVKLGPQQTTEQTLADEILKTTNAYVKETNQALPEKIVILANKNIATHILQNKAPAVPIETLDYLSKYTWSAGADEKIKTAGLSVTGITGLTLKKPPFYLNILPGQMKEAEKRALKKKEIIKSAVFVFITFCVLALAITKDINNKKVYRDKLGSELEKISSQAKRLEALEHRFALLEAQGTQRLALLDSLYEIHKIIPQGVLLNSFSYEEKNQIAIRGQTQNLDSVLDFVSYLEKAQAFKDFSVKVRYATKKRNSMGEFIDFEIICLNKK